MAYTKKTFQEIKDNMVLNVIQNVDEINDANIGSVLDIFLSSLANELETQYEDLDVIYDGTRILTATGDDLDNIGAIVGVDRAQGSTSGGDITFIVNSPVVSDLIIPTGSVVSTKDEGVDLLFTTTADGTILTTDTTVQQFYDGVYDYKLDSRLFEQQVVDGTASSSPNTFIEDTDYSVVTDFVGNIIDTATLEVIDDCENATTNWVAGLNTNAMVRTAVYQYQNAFSYQLIKSGASGANQISYTKTLGSPVDFTDKKNIWYFRPSQGAIDDVLTNITIQLGSGGDVANSFEFSINPVLAFTADEFNETILNFAEATINGNPDLTAINFIKIIVDTSDNSDDLSLDAATNSLTFDYIISGDIEEYRGTVLRFLSAGTLPDDNTAISTVFKPLSIDIASLSNDVGVVYNVGIGQIIFKVTNLPSVNSVFNFEVFAGGTDIETDTFYRERIQAATEGIGVATEAAIKSSVVELSFIQSALVQDLPITTETDEVHPYSTATQKYTLNNQLPIDNATLIVSTGAGGTGTVYTKDTDYELNSDGEIDFSIGGIEPADTTPLFNTYDYNKLGFFNVVISGILGNLTTAQITETQELVDSIKAAGTSGTVSQTTYKPVDVEVTPVIESGFSVITVKANINSAITDYINSLEIGEDVLVASIIQASMNVDGVENVSLINLQFQSGSPGTVDLAVAVTENATVGDITVN